MDEKLRVDAVDPEEAFTALSDGTRVDVLRALWDADGHEATFSDLREAVGMRDSGQFNYHLDTLVGRFVTRTDDGYELTEAGMQVNGAIRAGAYTMDVSIEPIPLDDPCPSCGGGRTLHYEDETARIECDRCEIDARFGVPPGVVAECDREAIPAVASRYVRTMLHRVETGFCAYCDGPVEPTVLPGNATVDSGKDDAEGVPDVPWLRYGCRRCGTDVTIDLGIGLVDHPAVAGFYYDRGVDVRERSVWEFAAWNADRARVRERDPLRASVTYAADGDASTVVVDEDRSVVDIEVRTG